MQHRPVSTCVSTRGRSSNRTCRAACYGNALQPFSRGPGGLLPFLALLWPRCPRARVCVQCELSPDGAQNVTEGVNGQDSCAYLRAEPYESHPCEPCESHSAM